MSNFISSAGTLHKFRIPGYPMTFKWKRNGRKYQVRFPIYLFFVFNLPLLFPFFVQPSIVDDRTDD